MFSIDISGQVGQFNINANFESSESVTAIFGRSGAGKSTLINMISGLAKPNSGSIRFGNEVFFDSSTNLNLPSRKRYLGHVFQESYLFPHLSVKKNLTFASWAGRRKFSNKLFQEVIELLEIGDLLKRSPNTLSGGEKQRVAIGRALLSNPHALLMDEPLASLDSGLKSEILPYLERLCRESGVPILYVSHSIEEVARLADSLVLLSDGKVIGNGPIADMLTRLDLVPATGRYEAGAILEGNVLEFNDDWKLTIIDIEGHQLELPNLEGNIGQKIRLRVRARDVTLATKQPEQLSIRNCLLGKVVDLVIEEGAFAEAVCQIGEQKIRARLTRASVSELKLSIGSEVYILIKSVAIC